MERFLRWAPPLIAVAVVLDVSIVSVVAVGKPALLYNAVALLLTVALATAPRMADWMPAWLVMIVLHAALTGTGQLAFSSYPLLLLLAAAALAKYAGPRVHQALDAARARFKRGET